MSEDERAAMLAAASKIGSDWTRTGDMGELYAGLWSAGRDFARSEAQTEIARLRSAANSAMVWAIDLAPQLPQPDVWRCKGCNSRGESPGRVRHGPVCPFGKLDAAMTLHQEDASAKAP